MSPLSTGVLSLQAYLSGPCASDGAEGVVSVTIHSSFPVAESLEPSQEEVEAAFRTIIRWAGDNPDRPGLLETPSRAARAFKEYFVGYGQDPLQILNKTFGRDGRLRGDGDICAASRSRAIASIISRRSSGRRGLPTFPMDGSSTFEAGQGVEAYAKRLQIQERLTSEIAAAVQEVLQPQGVGVVIKATHHCMSSRGIHKVGSDMVTSCLLGCFRDNAITRQGIPVDGEQMIAAGDRRTAAPWRPSLVASNHGRPVDWTLWRRRSGIDTGAGWLKSSFSCEC